MVGPVAAAAALHATAAEMAAMPAHTVPVEADVVVALDRHRVAFEPAHRRAGVEVCFSERRLQPGITMDMSSNETIKHAVMAGMGLSFLSLHTVGPVHCGLIAYFGPT